MTHTDTPGDLQGDPRDARDSALRVPPTWREARDGARQAPATWRTLPGTVRILVIARAVNRLGAFTLSFLAVVLTVELGATVAQAGLVMAGFGVATIPSRMFGGHLADRLGRKRTIILGLTGCAVGQTWIALASTLWSAVMAAILLGLMFEIYEPPSQAVIADVTSPEDRPTAYGLLGAAMAAAAVAAGVLAAAVSHWDLRWLFAIDAASCSACALLLAIALPADRFSFQGKARVGRAEGWKDGRLLLLFAVGTVSATVFMALMLGLPLTLIERGLPSYSIGLILAISALVLVAAQPLQRTQRIRNLDNFQAMTLGYLLLTAGLVINAVATNLPVFIAAAVLWSIGDLFLLSRAFTIVAGIAPEHARGRYLAIYGLSWGIATAIAPLGATQLLTHAGPALLWLTCALAATALAALQPALRRRITPNI
ncbi:putative MFS family arabinose efflux permease [Kribbella voronezhensis]|uniref:Putative MFS family arabinose efflux permease n=1 Tax=Kribbella voronezhensis TaxID=2512212 RepID=A0A4R7SZY8_9ACTN|nr:putative MFS family arabinose efflux permease [Kribbella voronezhensis]